MCGAAPRSPSLELRSATPQLPPFQHLPAPFELYPLNNLTCRVVSCYSFPCLFTLSLEVFTLSSEVPPRIRFAFSPPRFRVRRLPRRILLPLGQLRLSQNCSSLRLSHYRKSGSGHNESETLLGFFALLIIDRQTCLGSADLRAIRRPTWHRSRRFRQRTQWNESLSWK